MNLTNFIQGSGGLLFGKDSININFLAHQRSISNAQDDYLDHHLSVVQCWELEMELKY